MAKGNWHDRYKPGTRCRYCGYVIKTKANIYRAGVIPCHKECAERRGLAVVTDAEWQQAQKTA